MNWTKVNKFERREVFKRRYSVDGKKIFLEIPAVVARQVVYFVLPVCCCPLAKLHDAINFRTEDENQGERTLMRRDQKSTIFSVAWLIEISLCVKLHCRI